MTEGEGAKRSGLAALWQATNRRRLRNALRYLATGNLSLLRHKVRSVVDRSTAPPPRLSLHEALDLFRSEAPEFSPLPGPVDVIVPIYNNRAALPRLFDDLEHNTTTPFRLVVVDDASSDPDVLPFLEERLKAFADATLLRQEQNRGFVASVNRASEQVRHPFAIVNSDVALPPQWLERLMAPILAEPSVASTTPFTNAGTICSFPEINSDNAPFLDLDVAAIDQAFRHVDTSPAAIELPSGVGFCMGLSLDAWRAIGPFDEAAFGRGYGEENDWCRRAVKQGYRNLLVANLFVQHDHGGSFGTEASQALKDRNLVKVHQRHPDYQGALDAFMKRDPMAPLRALAAMILAAHRDPDGLVMIFDHDLGGGAQHYRENQMADLLAQDRPVCLVTNAANDLVGRSYRLAFRHRSCAFDFRLDDLSDLEGLSKLVPLGQVICSNLLSYPDLPVALHTLKTLASGSETRLSLAIHDYFPLCPSHNLLNSDGRYCDLPDMSICARCLPINRYAEAPEKVGIEHWRAAWGELIDQADEVLCFSESSRDLVQRIYPQAAGRLVVRPHRLPASSQRKPKLDHNGPLHIGVVGVLSHAKGADLVVDLSKRLAKDLPEARITVIGTLEASGGGANLTVTGPYDRADLPAIIERNGINMFLFPSIWPETFSYVAAELMDLGVPLCCFDLGAPAERLRAYPHGRIIDKVDPAAALAALTAFHRDVQSGAG